MSHLLPPLLLSLKIAAWATLLVALIAVPLSYAMARRAFRGKSLLEALFLVPLVLPPTVLGYLLLVLLGSRSAVGRVLHDAFGIALLFHWQGAVIAALVVALPLVYLPAKAGFASVERELEEVARLLGASPAQVFWHVSLPIARRGIGSGLLLGFARALGEFGATMMVLGNLPSQQTLPISIYTDYEAGEMSRAAPAVAALAGVSLLIVLVYNRSGLSRAE